ncbi:MAG: HD domain-containing protein [Thermaerobacter sp.]|nr:polynucleotide adenylyltransferase [Bacillota bacterium]REJ36986.1 MAG: polynucleotide adenylyltransferase [Bacillota bacterium]
MKARRLPLPGGERRRVRPIGLRAALLSFPTVTDRLIPSGVRRVLLGLARAGHQACLVGGCVRDLLLGRPPSDWDVATDARPERVQALFDRTRPTGIAHGTVTVLVGRRPVEVTTFRTEGTYSDRRRPDWVEFTGRLELDLARRDFTINAMALDHRGRLHDPFGGLRDLEAGVIRTVGDPGARFQEDALRMLRAVRFAAQLEFRIEPEVLEAIREHAALLGHVSAERIRDEFSKILLAPRPAPALETLRETGLLERFLPELLEGVGVAQNVHHAFTVWEHNVLACQHARPDLVLRLAALLHDVAKPRCLTVDPDGSRHFYHHEVVGAQMADAILRRLRFDNATREKVVHLIRHHLALHHYPDMSDAAVRRLIRRIGLEHLDDLIALRIADRKASGTKRSELSRGTRLLLRRIEQVLAEDAAFGLKDLKVDGHDVMRVLGIPPGPLVGRILNALLEAVLEDPSLNEPETLERLIREKAQELAAGPAGRS